MNFFLIVLLFTIIQNYGQDHFIPVDFPEIMESTNYTATTSYDFINSEPKVFNVHFYFLDLTSGFGYPSGFFNENYALDIIAKLNIVYNSYNIFFKS